MKKRIITGSVLVFTGFLVWMYFSFHRKKDDQNLYYKVKKGDFEVVITTTGELQAKNSEDIKGPSSSLSSVGVWQVKISDLVAEGTIVKEGDYIATLDRTDVAGKLKDTESELQKIESQFDQAKLDTSLQMRGARDELINLHYSLEEKKLTFSQSKFEPPAVIRQAEIDVEKAERAYSQAKENYIIKQKQCLAKTQEVGATLSIQQNKRDQMVALLSQFVIKAPKGGMVIYAKDWGGRKKTVGTSISAWEPAVATLPDLSSMIIKTYVNEVDVSKIKLKQPVKVGIDAFPDKSFTGSVISVANVGEQRPNSDAKVFEVQIKLNETDSVLRPAMSTSNNIISTRLRNVISIPLECLHGSEGLAYVYVKDDYTLRRQEVKTGISNSTGIIVQQGLQENEMVCISTPSDTTGLKLVRIPTLNSPRKLADK